MRVVRFAIASLTRSRNLSITKRRTRQSSDTSVPSPDAIRASCSIIIWKTTKRLIPVSADFYASSAVANLNKSVIWKLIWRFTITATRQRTIASSTIAERLLRRAQRIEFTWNLTRRNLVACAQSAVRNLLNGLYCALTFKHIFVILRIDLLSATIKTATEASIKNARWSITKAPRMESATQLLEKSRIWLISVIFVEKLSSFKVYWSVTWWFTWRKKNYCARTNVISAKRVSSDQST